MQTQRLLFFTKSFLFYFSAMFTLVTVANDIVARFIDPGFHHYNSDVRYVGCVVLALVFTFLKPLMVSKPPTP